MNWYFRKCYQFCLGIKTTKRYLEEPNHSQSCYREGSGFLAWEINYIQTVPNATRIQWVKRITLSNSLTAAGEFVYKLRNFGTFNEFGLFPNCNWRNGIETACSSLLYLFMQFIIYTMFTEVVHLKHQSPRNKQLECFFLYFEMFLMILQQHVSKRDRWWTAVWQCREGNRKRLPCLRYVGCVNV